MPDPSIPAGWLETAAASVPETPALISRDLHLSFSELAEAVASLCTALHASGVARGNTLAVMGGSALLTNLLIHSAPRLGFTLFPMRPMLSPETRTSLLTQAGVDYAVTDAPGSLPGAIEAIRTGELMDASRNARRWRKKVAFTNSDIHLIIATSGSSGAPKSVMLSGRNLSAGVVASNQRLGLNRGDCWLCCLPLFHIGGLAIMFRCAEAQASALVHERFDPFAVVKDLRTRPVTHLSLVPAMLARLLDAWVDGPPPSGLRVVLVGGGPLSPGLAARAMNAGWPLCVSYAMSETASQVTVDCPGKAELAPGRVGRPLKGVELRPGPARAGSSMRIQVRGDMVMVGYANPAHSPGDGLDQGWFETADLGILDDQGVLYVLGRADDMLVSGGETVHPAQVEALLQDCPGVDTVLVSARADEIWGDRLVAIYVGSLDEQGLARWARSRLAGASRPREYLRVEHLPVDNPDKPDRRALRKWVAGRG
jgi:O-succinylbenzoic acid--CoA ligase